jgi:hypothetical protein
MSHASPAAVSCYPPHVDTGGGRGRLSAAQRADRGDSGRGGGHVLPAAPAHTPPLRLQPHLAGHLDCQRALQSRQVSDLLGQVTVTTALMFVCMMSEAESFCYIGVSIGVYNRLLSAVRVLVLTHMHILSLGEAHARSMLICRCCRISTRALPILCLWPFISACGKCWTTGAYNWPRRSDCA